MIRDAIWVYIKEHADFYRYTNFVYDAAQTKTKDFA